MTQTLAHTSDEIATPHDERQQPYLAGVPGVRKGARWRRDSLPGSHVPWTFLDERRETMTRHRGRWWSERDQETRDAVLAQCWGVVEVGDVNVHVPTWMRASIERADTGEVIAASRNPRVRLLLATLWLAYERGTGGVAMTRREWAEVLQCSERSVGNYVATLLELGLVRRVQLWVPRVTHGEPAQGMQHGELLLRIGPALDSIALAVFSRRHVQAHRGEVDRARASAIAVALRQGAREAGRAYQAGARRGPSSSPASPPPPTVPPASSSSPASPSSSASTASSSSPASPRDVECGIVATVAAAPQVPGFAAVGWQNLPHSPLPPGGGELQGVEPQASRATGGEPPGPPCEGPASLRSPGWVAPEARPGAAPPREPRALGQAPGRAVRGCTDRANPAAAELGGARRARGPSRTVHDAIAELARTLEALGNPSSGAAVRDALEQTQRERWAAERRRAVLEVDDDEGST